MSSDDDVFGDFDDAMDTGGTQEQPNTLDSDDSFEAGPTNVSRPSVDWKLIGEKYRELKEESKRIDDVAREVRSLVMICKQMEECYSKRVNRNEIVASFAELRSLHDGSSLLLITVHNVTAVPMIDWTLSIHPSPIFPSTSYASSCQSIPLGTVPPGARKTFECHVALPEPPLLLELSLLREFVVEDVRKVFHVALDPFCVTVWNEAQKVEKSSLGSKFGFNSTIRIPNSLVDLLSGCPDTVVTPFHVFKTLLKLPGLQDPAESSILLFLPTSNCYVSMICQKDGTAHHQLTIGTESSRSHSQLVEQFRLWLIVEMSKLKSRPKRNEEILEEIDTFGSPEEVFQSMLAAFH